MDTLVTNPNLLTNKNIMNGNLSDDATAALLLEILQENTPKYDGSTPMPCRIEFVEE